MIGGASATGIVVAISVIIALLLVTIPNSFAPCPICFPINSTTIDVYDSSFPLYAKNVTITANENPIPSINQKVTVSTEVVNTRNQSESSIFVTEIVDDEGITELVNIKNQSITSSSTVSVDTQWTPYKNGEHTFEAFALSPDSPRLSSNRLVHQFQVCCLATVDVIIPKGAALAASGLNFEPSAVVVMIGVNNTIEWTNLEMVGAHFVSDTSYVSPDGSKFDSAVQNSSGLLKYGESFSFVFSKPGVYHYHGEPWPWLHGTVIVLPFSYPIDS